MLTIFPASTGSFEIIQTRLETSLITATTNDDSDENYMAPAVIFNPPLLVCGKISMLSSSNYRGH